MLAVVASMSQELPGFRRACEGMFSGDPQRWPVSTHVTGVGKERASAGISDLLDRAVGPDSILSVGFAGALRGELNTGDLVLSRRVHASGEETPIECDAHLLDLALETSKDPDMPRCFVADSLTVPQVVLNASDKARLAGVTAAWVADMEAYWIGKVAGERGIPFLSVKAVLDTADQELPPFVAGLGNKGALGQLFRVAANLIVRPRDVPSVLKLSKQVKTAQDSVATFGLSFVQMVEKARCYA